VIKVTDIIVDTTKTLGTQLWLVDVQPYYRYSNGTRTSTIEGYKYTIAAMERGLRKIVVKIAGDMLMATPEKYKPVRLTGLEMRLYRRDGDYGITATATGIAEVQPVQQPQPQQVNNK